MGLIPVYQAKNSVVVLKGCFQKTHRRMPTNCCRSGLEPAIVAAPQRKLIMELMASGYYSAYWISCATCRNQWVLRRERFRCVPEFPLVHSGCSSHCGKLIAQSISDNLKMLAWMWTAGVYASKSWLHLAVIVNRVCDHDLVPTALLGAVQQFVGT